MKRTGIRRATIADKQVLGRLRAALWPESSALEHELEAVPILEGSPPSTLPLVIFVADDTTSAAQIVVGFIEVGLRSHADGCDPKQPVGFIEGWFVEPSHRGRGVGRALMRAAEAWALERGCIELGSDTWIDSEGSIEAHRALGFEIVDRCVNFRKRIG